MIAVLLGGVALFFATRYPDLPWEIYAPILQAVVALVLVWATWSSIARSDQQLDTIADQLAVNREQVEINRKQVVEMKTQNGILQKQIEMQEKQLGLNTEPSVLVEVNPLFDHTLGGLVLEISNLSAFPIHVTSIVVEEMRLYPTRRALPLSTKGLQPAQSLRALLLNADQVAATDAVLGQPADGDPDPDKYNDLLENREPRDWFPATSLSIEYYYGPTGPRRYRNEFNFMLNRQSKTTAIERYWTLSLKEIAFSRQVGDGSFVPLWDFTSFGERRPLGWNDGTYGT